jgi:aryl-phospho-beta-D-glucosidase BglC (GH1 family)
VGNLTNREGREAPSNPHGRQGAGLNRRSFLKSLTAGAALSPVFAGQAQKPAVKTSARKLNDRNPRWYGFNLLEYWSTDPDWMKYFPFRNDGMFVEDDFRWTRDWGFNFVRLPMDYRFWTDPLDLMKIHEQKIEPIDRGIRLGEKYGVHVNLCLHRVPGYCILDGMDPALTGIHVTPEKTSFYKDPHALEAFAHQWAFFAQRYKGISSERLSFNLVNEPELRLTPAEKADLAASLKDQSHAAVNREIKRLGEKEYARVARVAINAIRSIDPQRLIVSDGCAVGTAPVPDLIDTGVVQSCHDYYPGEVTSYKTEWSPEIKRTEPPTWPLKDPQGKVVADRQTVERYLRPWREIEQQGVRLHFGELGCNKHTPQETVLAWLNDTLDVIGELRSGWSLWNLRGATGVLDTERAGTKFEDWHGHQLDRALLNLLQKKMTS